jgi:hypothetical protein
VLEMSEALRPTNTQKAFDPKIDEFFQFCDIIFPRDLYRYTLDSNKVYKFMFFVSFRDDKNKAGTKEEKKAWKAAVKAGVRFDHEAYRKVMERFWTAEDDLTEDAWPKPEFPIMLLAGYGIP